MHRTLAGRLAAEDAAAHHLAGGDRERRLGAPAPPSSGTSEPGVRCELLAIAAEAEDDDATRVEAAAASITAGDWDRARRLAMSVTSDDPVVAAGLPAARPGLLVRRRRRRRRGRGVGRHRRARGPGPPAARPAARRAGPPAGPHEGGQRVDERRPRERRWRSPSASGPTCRAPGTWWRRRWPTTGCRGGRTSTAR